MASIFRNDPPGLTRGQVLAITDPLTARLETVEDATGATTSYLGLQTTPSVGNAVIGNATYLLMDQAAVNYRCIGIDVYGVNGGMADAKIRRIVPDPATGSNWWKQVDGSVDIAITFGNGLNELRAGNGDFQAFDVRAGERLAVYAYSTNGKIAHDTTDTSTAGRRQATGDVTAFFQNSTTDTAVQIRFHVQASSFTALQDDVDALESEVAAIGTQAVRLTNSDSIMVFGDSVSDGSFSQPGKAWPAKVSAGTDWRFETYANSGYKVSNILTGLRAGTALSGNSVSAAAYRSTHAIIALGINDDTDDAIATYQDNVRQLVETLRGIGYQRIALLSPHVALYGDAGGPAITRALAAELGCDWINVARQVARMIDFANRYDNFWSGAAHPGVRTSDMYRAPVEAWVRSLGRPRSGLKLFAKRSGVTVTDPEDVNYWSLLDRERLWKELQIGEYALSGGGLNYYDELDSANDTGGLVSSAYGAIIAAVSTTITAGDWGLIEAILPYTAQQLTSAALSLEGVSGVTVYVRDALGTAAGAGNPTGELVEVTVGSDGKFAFSQAVLLKAMDGDKLPIFITKSGGVAVTSVAVEYTPATGAVPKLVKPEMPVPAPQGTELLGEPLVGTSEIASWTVTGTVTPTASVPGGDLPLLDSPTEAAPVDSSNYIAQAVTWSASDDDQDMVITVVAGRFPALFANSSTYPDAAPITADTFDWAELVVEEIYTTPDPDIVIVHTAKVGLWWNDIRLPTVAPAGTTGCTIRVRSADATVIYVTSVSVKMAIG